MSIKSEKSLNDECSEIFEKSYSVQSASDDSYSDDDEDSLSRELLRKMTPAVLSKLRRCFKKAKVKMSALDIDRRVEEVMRIAAAEEGIQFPEPVETPADARYLDESGFISALHTAFGSGKYAAHGAQLFRRLDLLQCGRVCWGQLLRALIAAAPPRPAPHPAVLCPPAVLPHCQRETIVKMVSIETAETFCYAVVSRGGRVGVYTGDLNLLNSYEVFYHRSGVRRRVKNCWITDAIYMDNVRSLVLAASDRSLTFYDATTLRHTPLYCITGLPNIPTCLSWYRAAGGAALAWGCAAGALTHLTFLRPTVSLLHVTTVDTINYYFWMELSSLPNSLYCSTTTWKRVHARAVRRIWCEQDGSMVVSCSHDTVGLRLRRARGLLPDYEYTVLRGITCFHIVPSLQLLATGSPDGVVRLWGTTGGAAVSRLAAGAAPVLDVALLPHATRLLAFCRDCVLHIWDLYEECLLQSIKIKFPFLATLGKKVEFGSYCIYPGPAEIDENSAEDTNIDKTRSDDSECSRWARGCVVVCSGECAAVVRLRPGGAPRPAPPAHLRPRTPRHWGDLPLAALSNQTIPNKQSLERPLVVVNADSNDLITPINSSREQEFTEPLPDVGNLFEKAGLQGILEKDFVLMKGLKHELHSKMHQLAANMDTTRALVSVGAPYLSLRGAALLPVRPPHLHPLRLQTNRLYTSPAIAQYRRRRSYVDITPSNSDTSTPRNSKTH